MRLSATSAYGLCPSSPMTTPPTLVSPDRRDYKRDSYRGFGDGLARAFELAVTPMVVGAIGYLLDSWLYTRPLFMIVLVVLSLVGISIRMWFGYDQEMRQHETKATWAKSSADPLRREVPSP